jgi:hypothetical protein
MSKGSTRCEAPAPRPERHEPVEPDAETFDRVLAEQLAKSAKVQLVLVSRSALGRDHGYRL